MCRNFTKYFLIILGIVIILLFTFNIIIDPYAIYKDKKYLFDYNKLYSVKQHTKLKSDKYILVFGTSRTQLVSTKLQNKKILNFHNLYGEPEDILNFLRGLDKKQLSNIDRVFYLVSPLTMRNEMTSSISYTGLNINQIIESFLPNYVNLKNSLKSMYYSFFTNKIKYYINEDGSQIILKSEKTANVRLSKNDKIDIDSNYYRYDLEAITILNKINNFCQDHSIDIVYTTPTYTLDVIKYLNLDKIKKMYEIILNSTTINEIVNVLYIKGISDKVIKDNYIFFSDKSHLKVKSQNKVFKEIISMKNETINKNNIHINFKKLENK